MHLDLRVQALPRKALSALAREVAALGLNTLMIEWEGTYPFEKHPLISNEYAYTREELTSFIAECAGWGVEVIPLQQCFGHVEYILEHPPYAALRESRSDICQLCPCKGKEALALFEELFRDIASTHPSPYIHIGGDETYLLGHCPECRAKAEKEGKSKLYVDYFKQVAELIVKLGKRPLLWADMLLKNPDAAKGMPKECIFVDWNYGWEPNYFGDLEHLKGEFEFWGAPALRCHPDNHSITGWETHFNNLRDFIPFARTAGYQGMILTSWSTSGIYGYHWEMPGDLLELLPMRRVYPLGGFRILKVAFAEAVHQPEPFEPEAFVIRYAEETFGLTAAEGKKLWKALIANPTVATIRADLDAIGKETAQASRTMAALQPRSNKKEFEHLRLMSDLRDFHVRFRKVEAQVPVGKSAPALLKKLVAKLEALLEENKDLNRRYLRLNKGELYPAELQEELKYRTLNLTKLHRRLSRAGRAE